MSLNNMETGVASGGAVGAAPELMKVILPFCMYRERWALHVVIKREAIFTFITED